jgi:uncharacterized membrane protein YfcA
MAWFGFLLLGLFAGVVSGLFGIGGGLIIVPALVSLFAFPIKVATGTSLVALVLPVGILAVLQYYRSGLIGPFEIKTGLMIAAGLLVGAFIGAKWIPYLDTQILKRAFSALLLLAAVRMWIG